MIRPLPPRALATLGAAHEHEIAVRLFLDAQRDAAAPPDEWSSFLARRRLAKASAILDRTSAALHRANEQEHTP